MFSLRLLALPVTAALAVMVFAVPASASDEPMTVRVMALDQAVDCQETTYVNSPVIGHLVPGTMYKASAEIQAAYGKLRRIAIGKKACYISVNALTGEFPAGASLDPATWTADKVAIQSTSASVIGSVAQGGDLKIHRLPTGSSPKVAELSNGDHVFAGDWFIHGSASLMGGSEWAPVRLPTGETGWIRDRALVPAGSALDPNIGTPTPSATPSAGIADRLKQGYENLKAKTGEKATELTAAHTERKANLEKCLANKSVWQKVKEKFGAADKCDQYRSKASLVGGTALDAGKALKSKAAMATATLFAAAAALLAAIGLAAGSSRLAKAVTGPAGVVLRLVAAPGAIALGLIASRFAGSAAGLQPFALAGGLGVLVGLCSAVTLSRVLGTGGLSSLRTAPLWAGPAGAIAVGLAANLLLGWKPTTSLYVGLVAGFLALVLTSETALDEPVDPNAATRRQSPMMAGQPGRNAPSKESL